MMYLSGVRVRPHAWGLIGREMDFVLMIPVNNS